MWRRALFTVALIGAQGCGGSTVAPDAGEDAGDAAPAVCVPSQLRPRAPEVFDAIVAHLVAHETEVAGNWDLDYGDATAYAPPVLAAVGIAACDDTSATLANATLGWERELVRGFGEHFSGEGLIGTLGLIETYARTHDPALAALALQAVDNAGALINLFGGLLPADTVEQADLGYGQTAATGLLVAIELRYVEQVDPTDSARLQAALDHARGLEQAMWSEELGYYRFNEGDDELHVYPQSAMMAVHALAGRLTGDTTHLDRAEALFAALPPVYLADIGAYHDSYQGTGDDYVSLSTTSYLLLALHLVARERPSPAYDAAIDGLVAFILDRLWLPDASLAYHHWEFGARADWYCTGCNFQLAYILLLLGEDG